MHVRNAASNGDDILHPFNGVCKPRRSKGLWFPEWQAGRLIAVEQLSNVAIALGAIRPYRNISDESNFAVDKRPINLDRDSVYEPILSKTWGSQTSRIQANPLISRKA